MPSVPIATWAIGFGVKPSYSFATAWVFNPTSPARVSVSTGTVDWLPSGFNR